MFPALTAPLDDHSEARSRAQSVERRQPPEHRRGRRHAGVCARHVELAATGRRSSCSAASPRSGRWPRCWWARSGSSTATTARLLFLIWSFGSVGADRRPRRGRRRRRQPARTPLRPAARVRRALLPDAVRRRDRRRRRARRSSAWASPAPTSSGSRLAFFAACLAITALLCAWEAMDHDRQREALALVSRTDPLTGCLNRRGFEERFDAELDGATRARTGPSAS